MDDRTDIQELHNAQTTPENPMEQLNDEQQEQVIEAVRKVIAYYRKEA